MAIKEATRARAPRGTKVLTQAFFVALDGIPPTQQKAVASAALAGIRDELKARRAKDKEAAARAKTPAKAKTASGRKSAAAAPKRTGGKAEAKAPVARKRVVAPKARKAKVSKAATASSQDTAG
jgi:hypothetical protein